MIVPRVRAAALAVAASCGLAACSYDDGYGYGGMSVGYGSGYYGSYYDDYYDPYYGGYGYGYPSYYGWYGGYYYPGTGYYVYDRGGHRHRWNDRQRRHWEGRRDRAERDGSWSRDRGGRSGDGNWSGYRRDRSGSDTAPRQSWRDRGQAPQGQAPQGEVRTQATPSVTPQTRSNWHQRMQNRAVRQEGRQERRGRR
jgi:hypothetical protein